MILAVVIILYILQGYRRIGRYYRVYHIRSGDRRYIRKVKRQRTMNKYCIDSLPTEINNHTDTIYFRKNFQPIFFISQVCAVSPFLDSCTAKQDVPICSAMTAVDLEDGSTILLEAEKGLYFS